MPALNSIESIADIQKLVVAGFTDWKSYGHVSVLAKDDLLLFNYTAKAQYEGRWNFFELVSRGLIISKSGEVVARSFDKFFNWGEPRRRAAGHIVTVTEKMDGSLGILYRTSDGYKITTRGNFDSEQALWATEFLHKAGYDLSSLPNELTLLFEIIYPGNRIVVDYAGREDLVLLTARNRFTGDYLPFYPDLYQLAQETGFTLPKVHQFNRIEDILAETGVIDVSQEGWVVEFSDGQRFKFKGDAYQELHRLLSGLSFKWVLAATASSTLQFGLSAIPDEFLGQVKEWIEEIKTTVSQTKAQIEAAFDQAPRATRKDFAMWVQQHYPELASYLFARLDGKEIEPLIYKLAFQNRIALEPEPEAKALLGLEDSG